MKSKKVGNEGKKLRPTIKVLEEEIKRLKEEITSKKEKLMEEIIYNFFSKLNSEKYGYLMDTIASANYLFAQKKEVPKEYNTFLLFTNVFLLCCKDFGVEQILPIGKEFVITKMEAVKKYKYFGEPFKDKERKRVTVVFPGWKYKNKIISLPTVKEIK